MRRWTSIARATALEILSEPLSLLLLLVAQTLATLAPAFHYHQFGEPTRMARDAGLSALFTCGLLLAVFGTVKTFRREIETGTVQMALAHPVSRGGFYLSKIVGAALALAVFSTVIVATSLTVINGAAIGGAVAAAHSDVARLWGPSLAIGVGSALLPLLLAAGLNRFARCRFVLTFFALAFVTSLAGVAYRFDFALVLRFLPVAFLSVMLALVFLTASAAAAVRFKVNGAAAATGLLLAVCLPIVGNYYLPDSLSNGGRLPLGYVVLAMTAAIPAIIAFLLAGIRLFNGKDVA